MKTSIKALLIAICSIIYAIDAKSQITIDSTDCATVGDSVVMAIDTMPVGILVLGTGAQTWDFTSMQIDELDSIFFVDPASTPSGANFPTADVAIDGATVTYQTLDATALINIGQVGELWLHPTPVRHEGL